MARSAEAAKKLSSILWASLAYLGGKRSDRSQIAVGKSPKVDITIVGTVGRAKIEERIVGRLELSPPQTTAKNDAAPADHVVACILEKLSDNDRFAVQQEMLDAWMATKALPPIDPERVKSAKKFLAELRSTKQGTKAGALVFHQQND